jgi:hypothetical protein
MGFLQSTGSGSLKLLSANEKVIKLWQVNQRNDL